MKTTSVVLAAMEVFKDKLGKGGSDVSVSNVIALLVSAQNDETPMTSIQLALGLSQAAASRNVSKIGDGTLGKPGLRLIKRYEDPRNRKHKLVRLTQRGRDVVSALDVRLAQLLKEPTK